MFPLLAAFKKAFGAPCDIGRIDNLQRRLRSEHRLPSQALQPATPAAAEILLLAIARRQAFQPREQQQHKIETIPGRSELRAMPLGEAHQNIQRVPMIRRQRRYQRRVPRRGLRCVERSIKGAARSEAQCLFRVMIIAIRLQRVHVGDDGADDIH